MTTFAAFAFALATLALCSTALADTPPARPSFKLRVTVHDGPSVHTFRLVVGPTLPCATANQKAPEQQIDLRACAPDDAHLQLEWYTRRGTSELRGSSAFPIEPGVTMTLGNDRAAYVEVAIQG
jgi:hypothetical protein